MLVLKPRQPQRIISGLRETFTKRYIVERTNKAEIPPEEQTESVRRIRGMKYVQKNRVRKQRVVRRIHGMKYVRKNRESSGLSGEIME